MVDMKTLFSMLWRSFKMEQRPLSTNMQKRHDRYVRHMNMPRPKEEEPRFRTFGKSTRVRRILFFQWCKRWNKRRRERYYLKDE